MNLNIDNILNKSVLTQQEIVYLLKTQDEERQLLFKKAAEVKKNTVGNITYYRGLIEFSNKCEKNCFYCGIRGGNKNTVRYELEENEILDAVKFAHKSNYASVVFQAGERSGKNFVDKVSSILLKSKELTNNEIGITLSVGEQTREVYQHWHNCGAHRYLLRIESTNKELYYKIHPQNAEHDFDTRMNALYLLKECGYQVGTGVMIGLPDQTPEDLANDLLFFKDFDVDMVGMGPYIEHSETPLYERKNDLLPLKERFDLALKMIAILRIMMPDINIAAATALQSIDPIGREKAIRAGANVIMPNITPTVNRKNYQLYENKPCIDEAAEDCNNCLEVRIKLAGDEIGFGKWGDSKHFANKTENK